MKYSETFKERFSEKYTLTVKSLDGLEEFDLGTTGFEFLCESIVNMSSEDNTYISNEALKDLRRWVGTIVCTNCGEIKEGLDEVFKNSGYKRFYEGLLQSAQKVSIETHHIL